MKNSLISLLLSMESGQINVLNRPAVWTARHSAVRPRVQLLRGRAAILAKVEMLEELCQRTGQSGEMSRLNYQMRKPTEAKKIPALLLIGLNANVTPAEATADDVQGAVMLYEYTLAGQGLRLFATDDTSGLGTVIAPAGMRIQVAEAACARLTEMGALGTLITVASGIEDAQAECAPERRTRAFELARQQRSVPLGLPLGGTFDETLAALGKHTRRNLRYYRRRLESDLGSEFVPQVEMSRRDFLAFNRASMNPATEAWAEWRYESVRNGDAVMFAGMRGRDGRWLSLIGGHRHEVTTHIDWQMNLAGLTHCSLSTVMRSYVLEHETELGMKHMVFTGGTPHSMRHSFACVDVTDVVALRRSMAGATLRRLARWVLPGNFLGQTLRDKELRWE
jgi:hypothetical protein